VLTEPVTVGELYWLGRITLARTPDHLGIFDRVFSRVFRGLVDEADGRGDTSTSSMPNTRPAPRSDKGARPRTANSTSAGADGAPSAGGSGDDDEGDGRDYLIGMTSQVERLATTDFGELSDDELRELYALMQRIRLGIPSRRARRHHRHRRGDRLDMRATLRNSRRHGGDPIEKITRRARQRPRQLVVLCDISGSMAPYSRACVQLLHAAAGASHAEVFTFATRLTRLTRALAVSSPDQALARAAAAAPDWRGGTRIGAALKAFVDDYGRRGVARGAVVVIVSDGWDRDDPDAIAEQMRRLRRLAHRIVWINPRSAADEFQPLAGGMAAALPYCDTLASGHSLVALADVMSALSEA
jgi:uncharacterized protein with von Willebrand factor type A (vWA) domain